MSLFLVVFTSTALLTCEMSYSVWIYKPGSLGSLWNGSLWQSCDGHGQMSTYHSMGDRAGRLGTWDWQYDLGVPCEALAGTQMVGTSFRQLSWSLLLSDSLVGLFSPRPVWDSSRQLSLLTKIFQQALFMLLTILQEDLSYLVSLGTSQSLWEIYFLSQWASLQATMFHLPLEYPVSWVIAAKMRFSTRRPWKMRFDSAQHLRYPIKLT